MARYKKGDRVGAVQSVTNGVARLYGYGKYVGDEVPGDEVGGLNVGLANPKIELDNGKHVFGCECWWSPEEEMRKMLAQCDEVIEVDIDEVRKGK